jgi:hypothetical protein
MRCVLFVLWLLVALALLFGVGSSLHSPVAEFGTPSFLVVSAIWLLHRHEQEATALRSWTEGAPNASPLLAEATQEAIADEDEDAFRHLVVLKTLGPGKSGLRSSRS